MPPTLAPTACAPTFGTAEPAATMTIATAHRIKFCQIDCPLSMRASKLDRADVAFDRPEYMNSHYEFCIKLSQSSALATGFNNRVIGMR
jgi:hypothetical protein